MHKNMPGFNTSLSRVLGLLLILALFAILESGMSYLLWLFFMWIGIFIEKKLYQGIYSKYRFVDWYMIISIVGLLIHIDNYYNFNEYFGYAKDDLTFFMQYSYLFEGSGEQQIVSSFIYLSSLFVYPIYLLKELSLLDVLPMNWLIASLTIVFLDKYYHIMTGKNIPFVIMLFGFCFRFVLFDTITRFYRDNLILLCLVIAAVFISQKKYYKSVISMLIVAILRVASVSYLILLLAFSRFDKIRRSILTGVAISVIVVLSLFYSQIVAIGIKYGSDLTRMDLYTEVFEGYSADELAEIRFGSLAENDKNQIVQKAYSSNSIWALGLKAGSNYMFPLTLESPFSVQMHYEMGPVYGFYFSKIMIWLCVISMIFTTSFLFLGIKNAKDKNMFALALTNIIFWILVLTVSGQPRHSAPFYMFNVIFITNGYYLWKEKGKGKWMVRILTVFLLAFVITYNITK